jgi:hypothetical protein
MKCPKCGNEAEIYADQFLCTNPKCKVNQNPGSLWQQAEIERLKTENVWYEDRVASDEKERISLIEKIRKLGNRLADAEKVIDHYANPVNWGPNLPDIWMRDKRGNMIANTYRTKWPKEAS